METERIPHPAAIDHLPFFITAPGQTDTLFNVVVVFLLFMIFLTGVLYLRLHALPEQLAHRGSKVQLQLVAVLGLIALLTHNQLFWIAALLLAMTDLPDFISPISSMAQSLSVMARNRFRAAPHPSTPASEDAPSTHEEHSPPEAPPIISVGPEPTVTPDQIVKNEQEQS